MSNLVRSNGAGLSSRLDARTYNRTLTRMEANTEVGLARIEQTAMTQVAKTDAVAFVGRAGMQAVAMVSQFEAQLGQACPMAMSRLQGIADMTALGIAEVVADTVRQVSR